MFNIYDYFKVCFASVVAVSSVGHSAEWSCESAKYILQLDDETGRTKLIDKARQSESDFEASRLRVFSRASGERTVYFHFDGPEIWASDTRQNYGFATLSYNRSADKYFLSLQRFDQLTGEHEFLAFLSIECNKN